MVAIFLSVLISVMCTGYIAFIAFIELKTLILNIMSTIQELSVKVDELQAALDAEQSQVAAAIGSLEAVVVDLKEQLANAASPEAIAEVAAKIDAVIVDLKGTIADAPVDPVDPVDPVEPPVEG